MFTKKPLLLAFCPFQKQWIGVRVLGWSKAEKKATVVGPSGLVSTVPLSYFVWDASLPVPLLPAA